MARLSKNSPIVEVFSQATLSRQFKDKMTEIQKSDYKEAVELIRELASDPNPMARYELNQIVAYVVDSVLDVRLNYLNLVAEVKTTAFDERPKFKVKTQNIVAFWQAIGSSTQKTKVGHKYSDLVLEAISARPVAEWAEVASGRYDFAEMMRDVTNEFESKVAQKVQSTLYAAIQPLGTPNYASGAGVTSGFDTLLGKMRKLGPCAIIADYEAAMKLPGLTVVGSRTSDTIVDEFNRNGLIATYKGSPVVVLENTYTGTTGFNPVLDPGYMYIVPSVSDADKTVKVQIAGPTLAMEGQNIADASYEQRYDKHVAVGVISGVRQPFAVYEDTTL